MTKERCNAYLRQQNKAYPRTCTECGLAGPCKYPGDTPPAAPAPVDNFANHPKSITEIKGEKSFDAKDWTPRDALINALRDIDSGELDAQALIVCVQKCDEGMQYYNSTPSVVTALGILDYIAKRIYSRRFDEE
jgi:hypothetical protein